MRRGSAGPQVAGHSGTALSLQAQSSAGSGDRKQTEKKHQARAPDTQPFGVEAFGVSKDTTLRWTGHWPAFSSTVAARPSWSTHCSGVSTCPC